MHQILITIFLFLAIACGKDETATDTDTSLIEGQVLELEEGVSALEQDSDSEKEVRGKLQERIEALEALAATLDEKLSAANNEITALENLIEANQVEISSNRTDINSIETTYITDVTQIENTLSALEASYATFSTSSTSGTYWLEDADGKRMRIVEFGDGYARVATDNGYTATYSLTNRDVNAQYPICGGGCDIYYYFNGASCLFDDLDYISIYAAKNPMDVIYGLAATTSGDIPVFRLKQNASTIAEVWPTHQRRYTGGGPFPGTQNIYSCGGTSGAPYTQKVYSISDFEVLDRADFLMKTPRKVVYVP